MNEEACLQAAKYWVGRLASLDGWHPHDLFPRESAVHCHEDQTLFELRYHCVDIFTISRLQISKQGQNTTTNLPGRELKSPATNIGMSALAAIFSSPFSNVCTWYITSTPKVKDKNTTRARRKWPYKCHTSDNTRRYQHCLCVLYNNKDACQRKNLQDTTEVINLSGKHELSKQMAYNWPLAIHTSKPIELDMYWKWTSDDKSFHTCQSLTSLSSWFAWMWVFA